MKSPYKGRFRVSQQYKGAAHQGVDLVGVDSKNLYTPVSGIVQVAGNNDPKGFGIYVRIREDNTGHIHYFGHMSCTTVRVGDCVKIGQQIGVEGSTGRSTGSHCHWEIRRTLQHSSFMDVCAFSGIPNSAGTYNAGNTDKPDDNQNAYILYTVKSGDSLWKIANQYMGSGTQYERLAAYNNIPVNKVIHPGDKLKIPK